MRAIRTAQRAPSFLEFSNLAGTAAFSFVVPNDPTLLGQDVYFQWAVFDPQGAFVSLLAMSNGLRIQVGE